MAEWRPFWILLVRNLSWVILVWDLIYCFVSWSSYFFENCLLSKINQVIGWHSWAYWVKEDLMKKLYWNALTSISLLVANVIKGLMIWGSKCHQNDSPMVCDGYVKYEEAEVDIAILRTNNGGGPYVIQWAARLGDGCLIMLTILVWPSTCN